MRASQPDVAIRPISTDELSRLIEALSHRDSAVHRERADAQMRGEEVHLIAWSLDEPVGHVSLAFPGSRRGGEFAERFDCGHVFDLFVVRGARRRGIGRAVTVAIEDAARASGLDRLGLSCGTDDDYGPARELYTSLGYREEPGTLHIESEVVPSQAGESDYWYDILTYWTKPLRPVS